MAAVLEGLDSEQAEDVLQQAEKLTTNDIEELLRSAHFRNSDGSYLSEEIICQMSANMLYRAKSARTFFEVLRENKELALKAYNPRTSRSQGREYYTGQENSMESIAAQQVLREKILLRDSLRKRTP